MSHAVCLGAVDWRHPAWAGRFYPIEMPEEWRLAYYSTQFRCVFLEQAAWSDVAPAQLAEWAADVNGGFRFLLEGTDGAQRAIVEQVLGEKLGFFGSRDDPSLLWFSAHDDMRALTAEIRARASRETVYLVSRDGDIEKLEAMQTLLELLGR